MRIAQPVISNKNMSKGHPKLKRKTYEKYNYTCQYCFTYLGDKYQMWKERKLTRKRVGLEVDHVIPLSKGGKWELTNLVACCTDCNRAKGDKLLDEVIHNG